MKNRHERRRAEKVAAKRIDDVRLELQGVDKLAQQLPDDRWYCVRVFINRAGAVHFSERVDPVAGVPR